MTLPTLDDCDECTPSYLVRRLDSFPPSTIAVSSLPFILTFVIVATVVSQKVLPLLSAPGFEKSQEYALPNWDKNAVKSSGTRLWEKITPKRVAAVTCAISLALSSVLVELILCEISNTLNPAARGLALRTTLSSLLFLIVIIIPALEIHSVVSSWMKSPSDGSSPRKYWFRVRYLVKAVILTAWLVAFWYMPQTPILPDLHRTAGDLPEDRGFVEACLERIGIVGISLMASLSGFAAVSSIWQTFGVKHRVVRETDISRKEAGVKATRDMLATKQSRLRALQRKQADTVPTGNVLTRAFRTVAGKDGGTELRSLEMEIAGLETMSAILESSLSTLQARHAGQRRAHTFFGRLTNASSFGFALYCLYRIAATSISSLRRWWQPTSTFATSDPINNVLAVLTAHYDSSLDRAAWARQISFALSGVMLLLSFNAVLQTFRLFSRFAPGLVHHAQNSLPLIISQIAGTYVISSVLLLRSNLPAEVSSVITEALGSPLDGRFVEGWFESWFLVAVGLTATGILVSRNVGSNDWDEWDDEGDLEMGKLS